MIVINLYGGPGTGKSTTAAGLFYLMKIAGYRVELITEYAKELVYQGRFRDLDDPLYILAKQNKRMSRLVGQVDYVVTDSPLNLGLVYAASGDQVYENLIWKMYNVHDNVSIFLNRVKPYAPYGRTQDEVEARALDIEIANKCLPFLHWRVDADEDAPRRILQHLKDIEKA